MENDEFQEIINQLHTNTVTGLDLNDKGINTTQIIVLAAALHDNTTLQKLNLSSNLLKDNAVIAIAKALLKNTNLKVLILSHNKISDIGATALANALLQNNTLKKLDLANNSSIFFNDKGLIAIANMLKTNISLKKLNLSSVYTSNNSMIALEEALKINTTLKKLNISGDGSTSSTDRFTIIANALAINKGVNVLILTRMYITDAIFSAHAMTVANNIYLQDLDIFDNHIADSGAIILANALQRNQTLTRINLRENRIGDKGATALAHALLQNTTLFYLYLGGNVIGRPGVEAFKSALDINGTLQSLDWTEGSCHQTNKIAHDLINDLDKKLALNFIKTMNNIIKLLSGVEDGPLALICKFLFDTRRAELLTHQSINILRDNLTLSTIVTNTNGSVAFLIKAKPPLLSFQAFRKKMHLLKGEEGSNNIKCLKEETKASAT